MDELLLATECGAFRMAAHYLSNQCPDLSDKSPAAPIIAWRTDDDTNGSTTRPI